MADLPTAFLQLLNSKDIYVTATLHTCAQRFRAAHGPFHAEWQERLLCSFPRLPMNSSPRELARHPPHKAAWGFLDLLHVQLALQECTLRGHCIPIYFLTWEALYKCHSQRYQQEQRDLRGSSIKSNSVHMVAFYTTEMKKITSLC